MFRPIYRYTTKLVDALLRTENARAVLDLLEMNTDDSHRLQEQARRACLQASELLDGSRNPGYERALSLVARRANSAPTVGLIEKLATALVGRDAAFRSSALVSWNQSGNDIVYVPPDTAEVPRLLTELEEWIRLAWDRVPAVVTAGIACQELSMVHAFETANPALSRLFADTVLARRGYSFGGYAWPEIGMAQDVAAYERASVSTHSGVYPSQADFTAWLEFFADAVAASATQARESVLNRPGGPTPDRRELVNAPLYLRDRQRQALEFMRIHGAIRSGQYQELVHVVPDTARRDFTDLLEKGLIGVKGVGRGTHYVLTNLGAEEAARFQG